jgi:CDP-diglyceride synthetase
MIQRIQTLYLATAAFVLGLMLQSPIVSFVIDGKIYDLTSYKLVNSQDASDVIFSNYPLAVLIIVTSLLAFITIIFFKNRKLQMKLTLFNWILTLGIYVLIAYYYFQAQAIKQLIFSFRLPIIYPAIAFILLVLAFKAIKKDEEIIQSIDRIR